jgi:hypothetical protein
VALPSGSSMKSPASRQVRIGSVFMTVSFPWKFVLL